MAAFCPTYKTSSSIVTPSWTVIVTETPGGYRLSTAIIGRSTRGHSLVSWFTSLTVVSLRVMLALDTDSEFRVATRGVAVTVTFLAQTQIQAAA